jgi:hypothetical protein
MSFRERREMRYVGKTTPPPDSASNGRTEEKAVEVLIVQMEVLLSDTL